MIFEWPRPKELGSPRIGKSKRRCKMTSEETYSQRRALRPPFEILYADELAALRINDTGKRPDGWRLSPQAVRTFVIGSNEKALPHDGQSIVIRKKFYGDDALIDRCIV